MEEILQFFNSEPENKYQFYSSPRAVQEKKNVLVRVASQTAESDISQKKKRSLLVVKKLSSEQSEEIPLSVLVSSLNEQKYGATTQTSLGSDSFSLPVLFF